MKKILAILILINFNWGFSQINLDSLMTELGKPKKFKVKLSDREHFKCFENVNKLEQYYVCLDSTGKLSMDIGVSVIYERFDKKGRITKRIGYHIDGSFYLWDYSPIKEWSYDKNTTVLNFYDHKNSFTDKRTETTDNKGRIIEMIEEGKDYVNYKKTVFQYNDTAHTLTTYYYDRNGDLKPDISGAAIFYQRKDSQDSLILEEKYYDAKHNLVDGDHIYSIFNNRIGYLFSSVYYRMDEYDRFLAYLYNAKGELVCCAETGPPYSIITFQIIQD